MIKSKKGLVIKLVWKIVILVLAAFGLYILLRIFGIL